MTVRKTIFRGRWRVLQIALLRLCIVVVIGSSLRCYCSAQENADTERRINELIAVSLDGDSSNSSTLALDVLCSTPWPAEHHGKIVDFFQTNVDKLGAEDAASHLRQLAEYNRPIALALIQEIRGRLSFGASQGTVDLIVALRELGVQEPNTTQKLQLIVGKDHPVVSPQAAATLLRMNRFNSVATKYLTEQLHSDVPQSIWRAAHAIWKSDCVPAETLPLLRRHLTHPDPRVRTLCANSMLNGEASESEKELVLSTLAGVLCLGDRFASTEFRHPSRPGPSHRILALRAIEDSEEVVSIFWGPLLGILTSEDSSTSQTSSILRILAVKLISRQEGLPPYVVNTLSIMAKNPELMGVQSLHDTSLKLVNEVLLDASS